MQDKSHLDIEEQWVVKYCQPINVKFTGVWDTVAALANSVHWSALTGGDHYFLDANLRKSERFLYHALAIDENRRIFDATLLTVYADKDKPFVQPRSIADVEQRWFCGSHGNVGGGNYSDIAAQIPLQWLMRKAQAHGLVFRRDSIDIEPNADSAELFDSFEASDVPDALQRFLLQHGARYWREIDRKPEPRTRTIIHSVNESIDKSVFARCRADPSYQPENLKAWAQKHGVTLTDILTSVRADDPSVAVPD